MHREKREKYFGRGKVASYVIFIKNSKDQGGKLARVSLWEELLVDFYETLKKCSEIEFQFLRAFYQKFYELSYAFEL